MKARAVRCLESVRHMCPYLTKHGIKPELIAQNASKCPFMKALNVSASEAADPSVLSEKLMDPLNFVDIDSFAPSHPLNDYFKAAIKRLHSEGRYRVFTNILRHTGEFPKATEFMTGTHSKVNVWCSNDYLGMGQHPLVLDAMHQSIDAHGAGSGGTRNIGGNTNLHVRLEKELATWHGKESALVCTSGYVANEAALSTLPDIFPQGCIYFSDKENHASMICGMRHSKLNRKDIRVFKHNDMKDLEAKLLKASEDPEDMDKVKIIVFESVYSMSGSIAPMEAIKKLSEEYSCLTYIDEVHAVGLYGKTGAGICQERGIDMDIISGTLGKAVGVHGGYIAANSLIADCIRSYASSFIFTTSLPPANLAGSIASIQYIKQSSYERKLLHKHSKYMKKRLKEENLPVLPSESHIVPLFIGNPNVCKSVSDTLLKEHGIYVQPINYPTVPRGEELLRLSPGPLHTPKLIEEFIVAAKQVWKKFDLIDYKGLQLKLNH